MSSRRTEQKTGEDLAFRYLTDGQHPEFSAIGELRRPHVAAAL